MLVSDVVQMYLKLNNLKRTIKSIMVKIIYGTFSITDDSIREERPSSGHYRLKLLPKFRSYQVVNYVLCTMFPSRLS